MWRSIVVLLVALGGNAFAQPRAVSVESTRRHHHGHPPAGLGMTATFGWAGQKDGPEGWSARLEYELFPFYDASKVGGFFGFQSGFEVWSSGEDNWGGSLPLVFVGGARVFPMRATLGVGLDVFLVDQVNDDTGFGMYAPLAMAKLGFDIYGWQAGAEGRIGYHWQIGADDHARWQFGFYVAKTMSPPPRSMPIRE